MKFPNLPAAGALTGTEIVPVTQGGVDVRTTAQAVADLVTPDAEDVSYDNATSGLTATNVQDAIDEIAGGGGGGGIVSIVAGTGISVDDTDPLNPIVSATGGGGSDELTVITEATAFTAEPATHSGRSRLILSGGDVTFDVSETYSAGNVFNIVATAALELVGTGVTLTPAAGGTLELDADMAVSVAMTSSSAGRVIGQTVPA